MSVREENQREKLDLILRKTNEIFGLEFPSWTQEKWNVDTLHSKSLISILHLLVYLATHFKAPIRIPENVTVEMLVVKVQDICSSLWIFNYDKVRYVFTLHCRKGEAS